MTVPSPERFHARAECTIRSRERHDADRDGDEDEGVDDRVQHDRCRGAGCDGGDDASLRRPDVRALDGGWDDEREAEQCEPEKTEADGDELVVAVDGFHSEEEHGGRGWQCDDEATADRVDEDVTIGNRDTYEIK
jgi:hypothetical protein